MARHGRDKVWRDANGDLHRDDDLPAVIYAGGGSSWHQHGKHHRDGDKPAIIQSCGTQYWYQHGKKHRDGDKPTIIYASGSQFWHQHGKKHRDGDKPAFIAIDGSQSWFQHDLSHRTVGPATTCPGRTPVWYIEGTRYSFDEWCDELNKTDVEKAELIMRWF